ncbi:hypothetical protein PanWU01x14_344510 [Parasponia andersonii]|uniref:Uncharacterized protein n=1 Tax=Parasponia andersonii TaxID=3476 RepID=A0A2P5AD01_PARAD|nr:hypothetical protein PanWU01x14_344510 [Parasponia andersonii]
MPKAPNHNFKLDQDFMTFLMKIQPKVLLVAFQQCNQYEIVPSMKISVRTMTLVPQQSEVLLSYKKVIELNQRHQATYILHLTQPWTRVLTPHLLETTGHCGCPKLHTPPEEVLTTVLEDLVVFRCPFVGEQVKRENMYKESYKRLNQCSMHFSSPYHECCNTRKKDMVAVMLCHFFLDERSEFLQETDTNQRDVKHSTMVSFWVLV